MPPIEGSASIYSLPVQVHRFSPIIHNCLCITRLSSTRVQLSNALIELCFIIIFLLYYLPRKYMTIYPPPETFLVLKKWLRGWLLSRTKWASPRDTPKCCCPGTCWTTALGPICLELLVDRALVCLQWQLVLGQGWCPWLLVVTENWPAVSL